MTRQESHNQSRRTRQRSESASSGGDFADGQPSNRDWYLLVAFIFLALVIIGRLVYLQVIVAPEYRQQSAAQRTSEITVSARRGTIYDRNGNPLATSIDATTIYANPNEVDDPAATATLLAEIVGGEYETYYSLLTQNNTFVYILRKGDTAIADALKAREAELQGKLDAAAQAISPTTQPQRSDLYGIHYLEDSRRVYPYGQIGGQVIGYVGLDDKGLSGLELMYDSILAGTSGELIVERGKDLTPLPGGVQKLVAAIDGQDIIISLDIDLQQYVESELARVGSEREAETGNVVVLDGSTGEIYATASLPLYDLNNIAKAPEDASVLKSISTAHEPGSTFKAAIAAAALEQGLMDTEDVIFVPEKLEIYDKTIKEAVERPDAEMSMRTIIAQSSNVGVSLIEQKLGNEAFAAYLETFGFGKPTHVDYPGESRGQLSKWQDWDPVTAANISFGQGVEASSLQMASFYGAIANGGILNQPHFLISQPHSDVSLTFANERLFSTQTSDKLISMLTSVVTDGTGKSAAVEGYGIAGKTGTAQKAAAGGGYSDYEHIVSFVGFFTNSKSSLVCLTSMDNPLGALGNAPTGPLFSSIMGFSATRYMITPDAPVE
ncbi:MAG: penicillin-binding protein 2 [Coriobacteriaceae bacterium]|nr:penicillin-binding protein 2 [Coriobacteriaceae bacterium]